MASDGNFIFVIICFRKALGLLWYGMILFIIAVKLRNIPSGYLNLIGSQETGCAIISYPFCGKLAWKATYVFNTGQKFQVSNTKTAVVEQALFVICHSTKCVCEEADVQTMEKHFQECPMRSLNKPGELARLEGIPRTCPGALLDLKV